VGPKLNKQKPFSLGLSFTADNEDAGGLVFIILSIPYYYDIFSAYCLAMWSLAT
jgi:hypothetical protein